MSFILKLRLFVERKLGLTYEAAIQPMLKVAKDLEKVEAYQKHKAEHSRQLMRQAEKDFIAATRESGKAGGKAAELRKALESDTV